MNVSLKNNDATRGTITLEIVKADYANLVEKSLRSFRQKANIPGFRKGMVPMSMVKKMYGKSVMAEEVNKLASEFLFKYIRENDLNILGEPLPSETEQKEINFDTQEDFEFVFDVAFAPEINIELNKKTKVPFYQINIDDEMIEKQVDSYRANFGTYEDASDNIQDKDLIKGTVVELENGAPKEGGIMVENAVLMTMYMKDEAEKAKFIGAAKNSVVVFNPHKAYDGAAIEISSFLKISKEQAAEVTGDFNFEIQEITRHTPAEMDQTLFDKVFGEGAITTEAEFREKIKEQITEQVAPQSDYKFMLDIRETLVKKAGKLAYADDFLKRWLLIANEKSTKEKIEDDYPQIVDDLTYQLIKESLVKKNKITVNELEIHDFAIKIAKAQFAQYGMMSVPDDVLGNYAQDMLKNKESLQNVVERAMEEKLAEWLKEHVKLDVKEVSVEEFGKLFD